MDEYMTVTLTLDNDEVVECAVLTIFSANGQDYIAHRKRSGRSGA